MKLTKEGRVTNAHHQIDTADVSDENMVLEIAIPSQKLIEWRVKGEIGSNRRVPGQAEGGQRNLRLVLRESRKTSRPKGMH